MKNKLIENYSQYMATPNGDIISFKNKAPRKLKPSLNNSGYAFVSLCDKTPKLFTVHRLIAKTFIPNPENKETVNHINGIKTDNRVENLEWMTYKENTKHSFETGLNDCGKKLSLKIANDIRNEVNFGELQYKVAIKYNVARATINKIMLNKIWINKQ